MTPGKTLFLSHKNTGTPNDIGNGYLREFLKNGAVFLDYLELYLEHGHRSAQKLITDYIRENGIEVLIFASDPTSFHFPLEFFKGLRPGVFTVMMSGDTVYYFNARDKYYAGAMDLFAVYDSFEVVQAMKDMGGDALIFLSSYDLARYVRAPGREKTIDVSFIGGLAGRKDRAEYIEHLTKNGVKVQVFGYGAPGGQVSQAQMVEIFNKSRINLNFMDASVPTRLTRDAGMVPGRKQLKGRIAEAALCGSFVLSEQAPGIEKVMLPDIELSVFSTKEELLAKTRFYLSHEIEREAIAEAGYRRARKDYDVSRAIPELLAEVETRRLNRRPAWAGVPPDAVFIKHFSSYRALYIIKFLKRGRFAFALEEFSLMLKLGTIDPRQIYDFFIKEVADKFPVTKAFFKKLLLK